MRDFVIFGECLVELSHDAQGQLKQGFAGDVYSVSVYLKRACPEARVRLLCALGDDPFSQSLRTELAEEGVDTSFLLTHPQRHVGLYSIHNDDSGERSFIYWRSESAARHTLRLLEEQGQNLLDNPPDCFYLSGISLAVAEAETSGAIWPLLEGLVERSTRIVFDTNYRPTLWADEASARSAFDRVLGYSSLVLPGVEDMQMLYGFKTTEAIGNYLQQFDVPEMVLKDGPADILYGQPTSPDRFPISPVKTVVDTTAAGDSFSGTLLGELARGGSLVQAIASGAAMSARVIQFPGAILPRQD